MHAVLHTVALEGIAGLQVVVEVDIARGLPSFNIVGLPDAAVRESRARIRSALRNAGFQLPRKRVTVNLSPADVRKEGPGFDFPIAACLLAAAGLLGDARQIERLVLAGELALDGQLVPVRGVLSRAIAVAEWSQQGLLCVPRGNLGEARAVPGLRCEGFRSLRDFVYWTHGAADAATLSPPITVDAVAEPTRTVPAPEASHIIGQEVAKRALVIAAAGGHNAILAGPPGTGKTLLARSVPDLLPPLSDDLALTVTQVYSIAGRLPQAGWISKPPFRQPHHSITRAGLLGSAARATPGELTLAHGGVLFLDELPEYRRGVLESLREPLETGSVALAAAGRSLRFPARPDVVIGALNLCPCGRLGQDNPADPCLCTSAEIRRYRGRVSGALWERFDLHVEVAAIRPSDLNQAGSTGPPYPGDYREVVAQTRQLSRRRNAASGWSAALNGQLPLHAVRSGLGIEPGGEEVLKRAFRLLGLSLRTHDRVLKVARTIADLDQSTTIRARHVMEALQYREPVPGP